MSRSWFKELFGFKEEASLLRQLVAVHPATNGSGLELYCQANQRRFPIGTFTTPSVRELRDMLHVRVGGEQSTACEVFSFEHIVVDDTRNLHAMNPGAVFQAASQMNALEFPSESVVPEDGITNYVADRTQGPACALACAAGTLYRNYFHPMKREGEPEQLGQTADLQINNLDVLEQFLDNDRYKYWDVMNGYVFSDERRLDTLKKRLESVPPEEITDRIKIGLHENVCVTDAVEDVRVTQAYCSALSCAYSGVGVDHWEPFATLVLDGMYEATILSALLNRENSKEVFLTFLGGGVFGNKREWIANSVGRAMAIAERYAQPPSNLSISVKICHYRGIDLVMEELINRAYDKHRGL
jgi:hypothetical protein